MFKTIAIGVITFASQAQALNISATHDMPAW